MKTLTDALVLVVNHLQLCSKMDDDARDAATSFALHELGKILRQLPDADLDQLAAVADVLVPILMDLGQGYAMRRAAFDGLGGAADWPARRPLFEALLQDAELAEDARTLLLVRDGRRGKPDVSADRGQ
jgi:hypothetical protein